jgi:hypothetical protein
MKWYLFGQNMQFMKVWMEQLMIHLFELQCTLFVSTLEPKSIIISLYLFSMQTN